MTAWRVIKFGDDPYVTAGDIAEKREGGIPPCRALVKDKPFQDRNGLLSTPATLRNLHELFSSFGGVQVKLVPDIIIVGVQIDEALNIHKQISKLVLQCYLTLITIPKISNMLSTNTAIRLVESLVSYFAYRLPAWIHPTQKQRCCDSKRDQSYRVDSVPKENV